VPDLHDLTALEQGAAIRSGEITARDLTVHYLRRAEALGPQVGAFITLTPEQALRQADSADAAARSANQGESGSRGAGDRAELSPLHGVVAPIKDLHMAAGMRCTMGSALVDIVPHADDFAVARQRDAGLVFTGTTNTPEFGLPCYTENAIVPPARTPWDTDRMAGGSSGGAAAAVSTGLAAIAMGSDGGGSIRIPASCCGLVGIKPSRGRVSLGPFGEAVGDLPVIGPLARTVGDAAAFLDVLAGSSPGDMFPIPSPGEPFLSAVAAEPGRLRIGRYRTPVIVDTDVDPEVVAVYEHTSTVLESLGHDVVDIDRPFTPDLVGSFEAVWSTLAGLAPVPPDLEGDLMPLTRWLRQRAAEYDAVQLAGAVSAMRMVARQTVTSSRDVDVVLTPTLAQLPAPIGGIRNDGDPAADFEAQKRFTPFTSPYNISGQPAVSLPLGWSHGGLPIGMQLVGKPWGEATIISLAGQLERATPWHERRHDLW